MKHIIRLCLSLFLVSTLGGCLLISPYHGQILTSRTQSIPFQAWTSKNTTTMRVECMPTNRFGPETSPHGSWTQVTTLPISSSASRDLFGAAMYSAAKNFTLPESCWYLNNSNQWYYTSLRIVQDNYSNQNKYHYYTLDRDGVRCTGESVSDMGSWTAWLSDNCYLKYTSGNAIKWMTMRTQN